MTDQNRFNQQLGRLLLAYGTVEKLFSDPTFISQSDKINLSIDDNRVDLGVFSFYLDVEGWRSEGWQTDYIYPVNPDVSEFDIVHKSCDAVSCVIKTMQWYLNEAVRNKMEVTLEETFFGQTEATIPF